MASNGTSGRDQAADRRRSALDGIAARLVAGAVLLGVVAGLAAIHWSDLFPPEQASTADPNDPAAACIAERSRQIEKMIAENPDMAGRKQLFLERAEAMCRSTVGEGSSAPPPLPRN